MPCAKRVICAPAWLTDGTQPLPVWGSRLKKPIRNSAATAVAKEQRRRFAIDIESSYHPTSAHVFDDVIGRAGGYLARVCARAIDEYKQCGW